MKLTNVTINNYRQFNEAVLDFDDNVTILAGANNIGKTSLMYLLKKIFSEKKWKYEWKDTPASCLREWLDLVFPYFENFYNNNPGVDNVESDLIEKIFPIDKNDEWKYLKTTNVKINVEYDPDHDDIKLFADYIMDLSNTEYGFYFEYCHELDRHIFLNGIINSYDKLNRRFIDYKKNTKDKALSIKRAIEKIIVNVYFSSLEACCYFCDKEFTNRCKMDDTSEFQNLFNFMFIKAGRYLDDLDSDNTHTLSHQMIKLAESDNSWQTTIQNLPDELISPIEHKNLSEKVRNASLRPLQSTIQGIEDTNGGTSGKLMLNMDITESNVREFLQKITTTTYEVDGYFLGEESQGLGYSNMISMHLSLQDYKRSINDLKVNLFLIEEPESHMHPQMQQVFIKYLLKYYKDEGIQGLVSTHSNEMVRVSGLDHLRVVRKDNNSKSVIYNPSKLVKLLHKSRVSDDNELANFYDWFFEIGYSELVFADKVIMYEGDTERLFIRKLITLPKYQKLSHQYISFIQVGGAYAKNYEKLLKLLNIKTLIFTDIDYEQDKTKISEIKVSSITNATLKHFRKKDNITVQDMYEWKKNKKHIINDLIYIGFQTEDDGYARTLEEAMFAKYYEKITSEVALPRSEWKKRRDDDKLVFPIPNNRTGEADSSFTTRDLLKSMSGSKTDFMYSVIMEELIEKMEPNYIREGLEWLQK